MSVRAFVGFWQRLTDPHASIRDELERNRLRLFISFLVILIPLAFGLVVWEAIGLEGSPNLQTQRLFLLFSIIAALILLIYWISRTKYYKAAENLYLGSSFVGTFVWAILHPTPLESSVPLFNILLASAFRSETVTLFVLLINCLTISFLPHVIPGLMWDISSLLRINIFFGAMGILLAVLRRQDRERIARQSGELSTALTQKLQAEESARLFLQKIADQTPGALFQFQMSAGGKMSFPYVSQGISRIHPNLTAEKLMTDAATELVTIHPDDLGMFQNTIQASYETLSEWDIEFRVLQKDGNIRWHRGNAKPERESNGDMSWYGYFQDVTERKQVEAQIERQLQHLRALSVIDNAIAQSHDLKLTGNIIVQQAIAELGVDAVGLLLLDPQTLILEPVASRGFRTEAVQKGRVRVGKGFSGLAALQQKPVYIGDMNARAEEFTRANLLAGEDFVSYAGAPLLARGQLKGVLEVFHRTPLSPDEKWFEFFNTLAGQAAIAINSAQSFSGLQRANINLALAYDATIEGWSRAMDLRDKETEGHTQRVTEMTVQLARALGMSEAEIVHVRRGALLHDMGKLGVPDAILLKPGNLSSDEWVIMRQHPQFAYDMLSPIEYLRPALDIPYCHHEKWDGTGYPRGLKGEQIPLAARIFAVVDVWDALRSDRPYRASWPEEKALEYIRSLSGTHFDPKAVEVFMQVHECGSRDEALKITTNFAQRKPMEVMERTESERPDMRVYS